MNDKKVSQLILDGAEAVSYNVPSAQEYLSENNVNIEHYLIKGFELLTSKTIAKPNDLNKSETFFRRVVLAAKIANECHKENTFGSVKFQKLVFLCEHVSEMNFISNYSKQAAGPMDNKFIHTVKLEFEKLKWFKVEKIKNGIHEKVTFTPLEKIDAHKKYFSKYFSKNEIEIESLIETFKKSRTDEVELVATIYSCWKEIIQERIIFSENLLVKKFYEFHKEKKKFSEQQIIDKTNWMKTEGIYPV